MGKKTTLKQNNQTKQSTYFSGGYEKQVDAQNNTTELHFRGLRRRMKCKSTLNGVKYLLAFRRLRQDTY